MPEIIEFEFKNGDKISVPLRILLDWMERPNCTATKLIDWVYAEYGFPVSGRLINDA